jgi:predicted DNA-binding transcriptional regulator YafY
VGQRTATESIVAIVQAFLERRTWSQADLARRVNIGVPAIKRRLRELREGGMPLSSEDDHPHVYWSVPKGWFPGGVLYAADDVNALLHQLGRLPRSRERDRLLAVAARSLPGTSAPSPAVVARDASGAEERFLTVVEDAAARQKALRFRYFTASRGVESMRHASVHRVVVGPPARLLATCHRSGALKWFRLDNVFDAAVDDHEPFRPASPEAIASRLAQSLDGFFDETAPARPHAFFVREPEARWVVKNLLEGMRSEDARGGVRVEADTTAVERLARYVVGLGGAAEAITPHLRAAVVAIAEGALAANAEKAAKKVPTKALTKSRKRSRTRARA